MDEHYLKIKALSAEYIDLCNQFIQGLNDNVPAEQLARLKLRIRELLEEIERLELERGTRVHDKDNLPS